MVYLTSANLQMEKSEFFDRSGRMLRSCAALLKFSFGSNVLLLVCANDPFCMLTCLSDGLPVGMCLSCVHQKMEVAAEWRTVVAFLSAPIFYFAYPFGGYFVDYDYLLLATVELCATSD